MLATAAAWAVQSRGQELHGLLNGQQGPNYLNYPCRPLQGTWCWQEAGCRADVGLDPRHSSLECRHPKRQFSEQKQLGVPSGGWRELSPSCGCKQKLASPLCQVLLATHSEGTRLLPLGGTSGHSVTPLALQTCLAAFSTLS